VGEKLGHWGSLSLVQPLVEEWPGPRVPLAPNAGWLLGLELPLLELLVPLLPLLELLVPLAATDGGGDETGWDETGWDGAADATVAG
jgi:hypothetical protein